MGVFDLVGKAAKGAKKAAPFFSKADIVLDELPRGKGLGNEFLGELVKKGAKPTELRERGIEKALKDKPKMTKAEVQKVFESNPAPKVQEKVLTSDAPDYDEFLEEKAQEFYGVKYSRLRPNEKAKIDQMFNELPLTQYDRFKTPGGENYREILLKLPKQEKPITDADIEDWYRNTYFAEIADEAGDDWRRNRESFIRDMTSPEREDAFGTGYISSHYRQDPNLLAHIRVQDFTTPEGKKVLLVDEIQSDWHQEGRKKGYKSGDEEEKIWDLTEEYNNLTYRRKNLIKEAEAMNNAGPAFLRAMDEIGDITPKLMKLQQQMDELREISNRGVPDAPFKKNWHELAMKRVLDYAAENGYDTVAITPGAEQAKRYDLSKHVDRIDYFKNQDGTFNFVAYSKQNNPIIHKTDIGFDELSNQIGEDLAKKISDNYATPRPVNLGLTKIGRNWEIIDEWGEVVEKFNTKIDAEAALNRMKSGAGTLSNVDLQVGGEGMKGFYDKILPDYLNNFGKQYGASVREAPLNYTPSAQRVAQGVEDDALLGQLGVDVSAVAPTQYHMFDITPQLREEVKNKGLPMYGKVSMPALEGLAAGSGAATIGSQMFDENNEQQVQNPVHFTENPDAMLLELMQRN